MMTEINDCLPEFAFNQCCTKRQRDVVASQRYPSPARERAKVTSKQRCVDSFSEEK